MAKKKKCRRIKRKRISMQSGGQLQPPSRPDYVDAGAVDVVY